MLHPSLEGMFEMLPSPASWPPASNCFGFAKMIGPPEAERTVFLSVDARQFNQAPKKRDVIPVGFRLIGTKFIDEQRHNGFALSRKFGATA